MLNQLSYKYLVVMSRSRQYQRTKKEKRKSTRETKTKDLAKTQKMTSKTIDNKLSCFFSSHMVSEPPRFWWRSKQILHPGEWPYAAHLTNALIPFKFYYSGIFPITIPAAHLFPMSIFSVIC